MSRFAIPKVDAFMYGTAGDDDLIANAFTVGLFEGAWKNWIGVLAGAGNDEVIRDSTGNGKIKGAAPVLIDGGADRDKISYEQASAGVEVRLDLAWALMEGAWEYDYIINFEDIEGSAHDDTLHGDDGDNWIHGGDGDDEIVGNGGDDTMWGGEGDDTIDGGDGNDVIKGSVGVNHLSGGNGHDEIWLHPTQNFASGGAGSDQFMVYLDVGNQQIDGGSGEDTIDTLLGMGFGVEIDLSAGHIVNVENAYGGNEDDTITGDDGDNILRGREGNDTMEGNGGNDTMYGGEDDDFISGGDGFDTLEGDAGNDTMEGGADNDDLYGWDGNDMMSGGTGADMLDGMEGNDTLNGDQGVDVLFGGDGNDILKGGQHVDYIHTGAGADIVVLTDVMSWDVFWDFDLGTDKILIKNGIVDDGPIDQVFWLAANQAGDATLWASTPGQGDRHLVTFEGKATYEVQPYLDSGELFTDSFEVPDQLVFL